MTEEAWAKDAFDKIRNAFPSRAATDLWNSGFTAAIEAALEETELHSLPPDEVPDAWDRGYRDAYSEMRRSLRRLLADHSQGVKP